MKFNVYKITLKPEEELILPEYSGFAFRGLFGNALKKTVCVFKSLRKNCEECMILDKCIYSFIFESPALKKNGYLKGVSNIPHPFIIFSENLNIYLTLFGKACEYLPFLIFAFEKMGQIGIGKNRGKFRLKSIEKFIGIRKKEAIYENGEIKKDDFSFNYNYFMKLKPGKEKITLKTLTPVRIKKNNRFLKDITLEDLMLSLKRRLLALNDYYGDKKIEFPKVEDIVNGVNFNIKGKFWKDLTRYSSRQKTRMKMGGLMFEAEINGDLHKLYPYLKLMEFVHIGKNPSFGLGKIKVS